MSQTQAAPFVRSPQPNWARGKSGGYASTTKDFILPTVGDSAYLFVDDTSWVSVGHYLLLTTATLTAYLNVLNVANGVIQVEVATFEGGASAGSLFASGAGVRVASRPPMASSAMPIDLIARLPGQTTVQGALEELSNRTLSVKAYGAKGDNATDDTTAIQNALTECYLAGGGTVLVPRGIYKTTAALQVNAKVSIVGEGGECSIISPLSCGGLTFVSGNYDGGDVRFRNFGLIGCAGSAAGQTAITSLLPAGGTHGVESRDGMHFEGLKISEWNVGLNLTDLREFTITKCKVNKVNNPVALGTYAISGVISQNFFTLEGGCTYGGAANKYGIILSGPATEGIRIIENQIFGFDIDAELADATWVVFNGNDCFSTVNCVRVTTVNSGLTIKGNYFEVGTANSVAIYAVGLGSESFSMNNVEGNNFICDSVNAGVSGIQLNGSGNTNNFNWRIAGNIFQAMTATDLIINNGGNVIVEGNRFLSTTPTNNIFTISIRNDLPIYIQRNRLAKAIAYDAGDYTAGKIIIGNNVVSGTQSFGTVRSSNAVITGGSIDGTPIGATTPSTVKGSLFSTVTDGGYTPIGNTLVFANAIAADGLWLLTLYGIQDTNVSNGPGMYLIQTRGTSATVTAVLAYAGMTVTVDGANKINIANGTAFNVVIQCNLICLR